MMRAIATLGLVLAALCPSVARAASCSNAIQDGSETDVDCGGSACARCTSGRRCLVLADCTSFVCTGGVCQPPTCVDGVRNGDEVDVDCGGSICSMCASCTCSLNTDCVSLVCQNCQCMPPTCTDGVKNGNEITVDCGGTCVPCSPATDSGMTSDAMAAEAGGSSFSDTGPPSLDAGEPRGPHEAATHDATTVSTRDASSVPNGDSGIESRDGSEGQSAPMPTSSSAPTVSPPSSTDSGTLGPPGATLHGQSTEDSSGCGCRVGEPPAPRAGSAMSFSAIAVLLVAGRRSTARRSDTTKTKASPPGR